MQNFRALWALSPAEPCNSRPLQISGYAPGYSLVSLHDIAMERDQHCFLMRKTSKWHLLFLETTVFESSSIP